jgi:hypothetical protein
VGPYFLSIVSVVASPCGAVARAAIAAEEVRVWRYPTLSRAGYLSNLNPPERSKSGCGGGINWWFKERLGLRLELRDNIWPRGDTIYHIAAFRVGLMFR